MVDAILFDLGDTIINFGIGRKRAEIFFKRGARLSFDYLASHGRELPAYAVYFKTHYRLMQRAYIWSKITRRDFNYEDVLSRVAQSLHIPLNSAELRELAWRWYLPIADSSDIDPGVHSMLETLRAAGTKMALVSNTLVPGYCMDRHLDAAGLLGFFPVRIYSSHTRYRKPHRRIFEIALDALNVSADKAIFVGDLLKADIGGGRRMGMRTVWKPARSARAASPKPRHTPTHTIARITQLPDILPDMGWRAALVPAVA